MGRGLVLGLMAALALALALAGPAGARAATETASGGGITARLTSHGRFPTIAQRLQIITAGGRVAYDRPVRSRWCGSVCEVGGPVVHVLDLQGDGRREVLLDLFTGGAHCCGVEQVFVPNAAGTAYTKVERDFGDPGAVVKDLRHDGRLEFVTADDSFAYAFTDYAASGLPLQILTFTGGRFVNVTRSYPGLIRRDAAMWLRIFKRQAPRYVDTVGVIAAWAADEYLLGQSGAADRYLLAQARARHLNVVSPTGGGGGRGFVSRLQAFLRRHGY